MNTQNNTPELGNMDNFIMAYFVIGLTIVACLLTLWHSNLHPYITYCVGTDLIVEYNATSPLDALEEERLCTIIKAGESTSELRITKVTVTEMRPPLPKGAIYDTHSTEM